MTNSTTNKVFQQVPKFNGENWENWSFSVKATLLFLNALGIADRTETYPTDATKIEDYEKWTYQVLEIFDQRSSGQSH